MDYCPHITPEQKTAIEKQWGGEFRKHIQGAVCRKCAKAEWSGKSFDVQKVAA